VSSAQKRGAFYQVRRAFAPTTHFRK